MLQQVDQFKKKIVYISVQYVFKIAISVDAYFDLFSCGNCDLIKSCGSINLSCSFKNSLK